MTDKLKSELSICAERITEKLSDIIKGYKTSKLYIDEMSELVLSAEYSLLAGGKRIRPYLAITFCKLCGGKEDDVLSFAAAIEMIHTYSLIHDDLPCMDNDDFRRGKPTNHKVFGEATALLAGDALLTEAFSVISGCSLSDTAKIKAVSVLSEKAGILGMIGGQEIDLKSENKEISIETLYALHGKKTGMLIEAACLLGCIAAGCYDGKKYKAASEFAKAFGLAFQITDDILDITGTQAELGKNTGSDTKENKSTTVSHLGLDGAKLEAEKQVNIAKSIIKNTFNCGDTEMLCELCDFLLTRRS